MLDEFSAITTRDSPTLEDDLGVWLLDYNYRRVHGSLGMTPMQRFGETAKLTPFWDEVAAAFDPIKEADYIDQLTLKRLRARAPKK